MSTDSCVFAVWVESPALLGSIHRRVEAIVDYYAPLGVREWRSEWHPDVRILTGAIVLEAQYGSRPTELPEGGLDCLTWGDSLPRSLASANAIVTAAPERLRDLAGGQFVVGVTGEAARVATGAGVTAGYRCDGPATAAWTTHATAASVLARGAATIRAGALPELAAAQFVGAGETQLEGVTALPPATVIDIDRDGPARAGCHWSLAERWEPVDEVVAQATGEQALLAALERSVAGRRAPFVGLTAGLDSRVVAAALWELGVRYTAFTWGEPASADIRGAREAADSLGVAHRSFPIEWLSDDEGLDRMLRDVRWHEGVLRALPLAVPRWPVETDLLITGVGGEVARAFHYRLEARNYRAPNVRQLRAVLGLERRLRGASREARELVRSATRRWVEQAAGSGLSGWRLLDVVHAEQRLRRWGRAQLLFAATATVAAYTAPPIARALVSLPLEERCSDGFQRRFLDRRAPALAPVATREAQRRGVPPPVRRLVSAVRRAAERSPAAPSPLAQRWPAHPRGREWVADALRSPIVVDALGRRWSETHRAGFLGGDARADDAAGFAASLAAYEASLEGIRRRRRELA